ncbi:hypothetical protein MUB18_20585 [Sphingobacterium sp. PCS056]|uniref:hypothetical protein n=1 Tax=Sphingobacterium sp. PCS056 TaxID=2931400 RepID=UPI00200FC57C|nr:hypothetical protein [Sphingobacterium sp. PCS056]UPZ36486.1 hypothetical protein MUB18_20585 [Sphingobacterium sp. PCS056]
MREDERCFIGEHMYRIDTTFEELIQIGNPDNIISIDDMVEYDNYYAVKIDPKTGQLVENENTKMPSVKIPKICFEEGYGEGSAYAENFNKTLSKSYGVKLIDNHALAELENMPMPCTIRELPTIEKNGFQYEIDVSLREIRKKDEPLVFIDLNGLEPYKGKYGFFIDENGKIIDTDDEKATLVEIKHLVKEVPEEVSRVYGIPVENLPKKDWKIRSNPDYVDERIKEGTLPVIRIVDEDYFVDTRLRELRSSNKFWKTIELNETGGRGNDEYDDKFVYIYDYLNRKIIPDNGDLKELPPHTVMIVVPDIETLDPISRGREIYGDPYHLLDRYPYQAKMEARVIPIEKTQYASLIKASNPVLEQKDQLDKNTALKTTRNKGQSY